MKKYYLTTAIALTLASSMMLSSCIGSFSLTKNVLTWNKQIGNKFVNELVFFTFWILPVYEVTSLVDLVVLNSIEFWSGRNPVTSTSTRVINTAHGPVKVECDETGYTITDQNSGQSARLNFNFEESTWSIATEQGDVPFMTFVDEEHVRLITPQGDFRTFDISAEGVLAYQQMAMTAVIAQK